MPLHVITKFSSDPNFLLKTYRVFLNNFIKKDLFTFFSSASCQVSSYWLCVLYYFGCTWTEKLKVGKRTSLECLCNVSKKTSRMKFIFHLQPNIKNFFTLILSFRLCVARYVQMTQNNKYAIYLQYFIKRLVMKLIFCMEISKNVFHKLILWGSSSILKFSLYYGDVQAFSNFPKNQEIKKYIYSLPFIPLYQTTVAISLDLITLNVS